MLRQSIPNGLWFTKLFFSLIGQAHKFESETSRATGNHGHRPYGITELHPGPIGRVGSGKLHGPIQSNRSVFFFRNFDSHLEKEDD